MRSGYNDDCDLDWDWVRWRGAVASSIRGSRGQKMLRDLLAELDSMEHKELIHGDYEKGGKCCALGAAARRRSVDLGEFLECDYEKCNLNASKLLDIAPALVREIQYINDNPFYGHVTDRQRYEAVRGWVIGNIKNYNGRPTP